MSNIRLKKGQVDPKNPHATSVKGAATLKNIVIDNVVIASTRKIDLMAQNDETEDSVVDVEVTATPAAETEPKKDLSKNKNGYAWWVSGVDYDGVRHEGIQYAHLGHPAMDFFAKDRGIKFKSVTAVKPRNLHPDICEQLGITEYR